MAKKKPSSALNRFAGKKIVFSGKFDYGVQEALKSMAEAQQASMLDDLTDKVDYLVLPDLNAGKTIQKKAESLNRKGASIQVMDAKAFRELAMPTQDEFIAIIKDGKRGAKMLAAAEPSFVHFHHGFVPDYPRIIGVKFDGLDLSEFKFGALAFEKCSFVGTILNGTSFDEVVECDFSKATGNSPWFGRFDSSKFVKADFQEANFCGSLAGSDFTAAKFNQSVFSEEFWRPRATKQISDKGPRFSKASLRGCVFNNVCIDGANFDESDLEGASFKEGSLKDASFQKAKARDAFFVTASLTNADFSGAILGGANFAEANLATATLDNADLTGANLRGAKINHNTIKKAKGISSTVAAVAGPALTELDSILNIAKTMEISFRVRQNPQVEVVEVRISVDSRYAGANRHVAHFNVGELSQKVPSQSPGTYIFSDVMLHTGRMLGCYQVCFETLEVSSTKSPKSGKELQKLVMQGIAEAFGQEIPAEDVLAAAMKSHRAAEREKGSAAREQREKAKAEAEKQKEKAKKQIAKKVEKAVGKVTDIATFLKALEVRIEKPKIDKATKMLKASGFKLFNDVTDQSVSGVVKSQTDPDLVYACRVDHEGHYSCCTQNLNVCGGLRGSICKHLLVLIVGLVQAGELDPTTIDAWIAKTHNIKAELDKENMGAIFIKYKGAEAGEVDWRPTETVPEDYYAL